MSAGTTNVNIDLTQAQELVGFGIRRAAAFIAIGARRSSDPVPQSLAIDRNFPIRWFPQPIPAELGQSILGEYSAWIAGAGLREAEQYFAVYLNDVWHVTRIAAYGGEPIGGEFHRDEAFDSNSDLEGKFRRVCDAIGLERPTAERFRSFVRARSALMHNRGNVRLGDRTRGDKLVVAWLEPRITANGREIDPRKGEAPAAGETVSVTPVEREKAFGVGEMINLDAWELSSILFTYQAALEQISKRLPAFLREKGLAVTEKARA